MPEVFWTVPLRHHRSVQCSDGQIVSDCGFEEASVAQQISSHAAIGFLWHAQESKHSDLILHIQPEYRLSTIR